MLRGGQKALPARPRGLMTQHDRGPSITAPDGWERDAASEQPPSLKCGRGQRPPTPGLCLMGAAPTFGLRQGLRGKSQAFFLCGPRRGRVDRPARPLQPQSPNLRGERLHFDPTPSPAIWDGHGAGWHQRLPQPRPASLLLRRRPTAPHSGPPPGSRRPQGPSPPPGEGRSPASSCSAGSAPRSALATPPGRQPARPRPGPPITDPSGRAGVSPAPASEPSTNPGPFCGIWLPRPTVSALHRAVRECGGAGQPGRRASAGEAGAGMGAAETGEAGAEIGGGGVKTRGGAGLKPGRRGQPGRRGSRAPAQGNDLLPPSL